MLFVTLIWASPRRSESNSKPLNVYIDKNITNEPTKAWRLLLRRKEDMQRSVTKLKITTVDGSFSVSDFPVRPSTLVRELQIRSGWHAVLPPRWSWLHATIEEEHM